MPEPQFDISCPSVASKVVGKMPKLAHLVDTSPRKGKSLVSNGLLSEEFDAKSHRGDIEGGNSMVLMWSHSLPGLISRSISPSGKNNK